MFKDVFTRLCIENNEAPTTVCTKIGLSTTAYSKWNEDSVPRRATLIRIADYFGVTVDYLLGNAEPSAVADQQKKPADPKVSGLHSTGYDELTPENREVIDSLIEKLLKSQSDD